MIGRHTRLRRAESIRREEGLDALIRAAVRTAVYGTALFNVEVALRRLRCRRRYGSAAADPYAILRVDPDEIRYWRPNHDKYHLPEHDIYQGNDDEFSIDAWDDAGAVVGGEWDRREHLVPFEETPKYRGVKAHFEDGVPWEETELFEVLSTVLEDRPMVDGCTTEADLRERYAEIDRLYERIAEEGYRPRTELEDVSGPLDVRNEIGVSIARDGSILFQGSGWHRLSIAKLLDVDRVPVRVVARHEQWQEVRNALAACDDRDELDPETERHLSHPDLRDLVPVAWRSVPEAERAATQPMPAVSD